MNVYSSAIYPLIRLPSQRLASTVGDVAVELSGPEAIPIAKHSPLQRLLLT